ncbi:DUF3662 domain-containing protein, partial [Nostocoides australiense]|uniref:DUF3662 domain-containing protein n=1 Tax=Nostocoides australiense TaxID=99480 RepID=UPI00138F75C5
MGRLQRIENKLERAINGAFAKAFRAEVQPVEIASAVRRAMDDGATSLARGRTFVPTRYRVVLSETDYDRLTAYEDDLGDELVAAAEEHAESQRYLTKNDFGMSFAKDGALETGVFQIVTEDEPAPAAARRMPPALDGDDPRAPARSGERFRSPGQRETWEPDRAEPQPGEAGWREADRR